MERVRRQVPLIARIRHIRDCRRRLKPEHAVDLDTGIIVFDEAAEGDHPLRNRPDAAALPDEIYDTVRLEVGAARTTAR
jgi:hypothetical protein